MTAPTQQQAIFAVHTLADGMARLADKISQLPVVLAFIAAHPDPQPQDDAAVWRERYQERRSVIAEWHAKAVALGYDGVAELLAFALPCVVSSGGDERAAPPAEAMSEDFYAFQAELRTDLQLTNEDPPPEECSKCDCCGSNGWIEVHGYGNSHGETTCTECNPRGRHNTPPPEPQGAGGQKTGCRWEHHAQPCHVCPPPEPVSEADTRMVRETVAGLADFIAARDEPVNEGAVEAACRAICAAYGWDPDEHVTYSGTRRKVFDREGKPILQWQMHERDVRAAFPALIAECDGLKAEVTDGFHRETAERMRAERAEAERDGLKAEVERLQSYVTQAANQYIAAQNRAEAALREAEKDAGRYRFARSNEAEFAHLLREKPNELGDLSGLELLRGTNMDDAIDAAIAARQQEKG